MSTRTLIVAMTVACLARGAVSLADGGALPSQHSSVAGLPAPALPGSLQGRAWSPVTLGAAEGALARRPGVSLHRCSYGPTRVALISTSGVKELHPPTVCLGAAGHEVTLRRTEQSSAGCLVRLDVRQAPGRSATFYYTFFSSEAVTCSFWERAGRAAWATLARAPARWSLLQVMDRDPTRARLAAITLLQTMRRRGQ